jgi:uncharacterized protein VirK/YbjX
MSSQFRVMQPLALPAHIDHPHQVFDHHEPSWGFGALAKMASYAVALARTDSLKKSVVFFGRTLVQWKKALRWIDYLEHYGRRTRLGRPPIELIRKSLGTYFVYQASAIQTHERLVDHFETAARVIRRDILEQLWTGETVELATVAGKQNPYRVTLCRADQAGSRHEGELTVAFSGPLLSGPLCRMTFIFARKPDGGITLAVGSTQGTNQADGKAAIVAATRDLNGLRPKDAMLLTLKGLAHRLGADEIFAVANDSHVINRRRASRRKRMWTDLDSYWIDRGGIEGGPFGYTLAIDDLSTAGVPSNRRDAMKKAFWDVGGMAL